MFGKLFKDNKRPRISKGIKVATSTPKRHVVHIVRDMKINRETHRLIQIYG